jgi:NADH-quinone oxidoreductase subunit N
MPALLSHLPLLTAAAAIGHIRGPHIDWAGLSPFIALSGGALVVLLVGLAASASVRERVVPGLAIVALATAIGLEIWRFTHPATIVHGALRVDDLALIVDLICASAALAAILMSMRSVAPREAGQGEYYGLLLFSVFGMAILSSSLDIITLFLGLELLSIPLYILCASEHRREGSLESGLKYLIIGSVGSATLLYGLAMIYGATGYTGLQQIGAALARHSALFGNPLLLTGLALVTAGFAFKASVAPFHQWTPDVYEGAPTPITAFMATATKASALAVFLRFFDVAAISSQNKWAPAIAAIAAITIIVGNVGALGQTSLKRMLGYSGVGQAGYMLSGLVVGTRLGISATTLYLVVYLLLNIAAFAAIVGIERDSGDDQLPGLGGLGSRSPWLAWPLTIGMLGLAGIPGTVGFVGKFQLIHSLVNGDYTWLAIVLVVGSMISLGYYLRVVAAIWMSAPAPVTTQPAGGVRLAPIAGGAPGPEERPFPPLAGGAPQADQSPLRSLGAGADRERDGARDVRRDASRPHPEVAFVACLFAAASVFFGVIPSPLFHLASHAGSALPGLF